MNRTRQAIARLIFTLICLCAAPIAANAEEGAVLLTTGQASATLDKRLQFLLEEGEPLSEKIRLFRANTFDRSLADVAKEGAPYQPVWGAVELTNDTPDDGRDGDLWHVTSQIHGLVALDVLVVRGNGLTEALLSYDVRAPFDQNEFNGVRLRSNAFQLAPEETVLLMAKMVFGPVISADLVLETPVELEARSFLSGIALTAFYAFSLACLLFFFGFSVSMNSSVGVGYFVLLLLGLGLIGYFDGLAFRFLYPDHPEVHLSVGMGLLFTLAAAGFWVAGHSVTKTSGHLRQAKAFKIAGLLVAVMIPLTLVVSAEVLAPASYIAATMMFFAHAFAVLKWRRLQGHFTIVMRVLSVVCAASATTLVVLLLTGSLGGAIDPGILIKVFYAVIGSWIIFGISVALVDLRHQHSEATREALAAARREARTNLELLETEQSYTRARDLAALRQRQLATASHDIKQPLMSLRLTMDAIAEGQETAVRDRLREAFDYMESLSAGYLEETAPDAETAHPVLEPEEQEPYSLDLIFGTVAQMFHEEAVSKGIELRVVESSVQTNAPVMAVMRIVSNLVSNAVKYTTEGRVLLGARRRRNDLEVHVFDTGEGMTSAEIIAYQGAYRKGLESQGSGLGLSICFELAAANDLTLSAVSTPGDGSVFTLRLPRVDD